MFIYPTFINIFHCLFLANFANYPNFEYKEDWYLKKLNVEHIIN